MRGPRESIRLAAVGDGDIQLQDGMRASKSRIAPPVLRQGPMFGTPKLTGDEDETTAIDTIQGFRVVDRDGDVSL